MYIPKHFQEDNQERLINFMIRYNFASVITSVSNIPSATHLPLLIRVVDGNLIIKGHLAKDNPQLMSFGNPVLVIFNGPHAYISPEYYETKDNVPTWNYIAVHAYGTARVIDDSEGKIESLKEMILEFEPEYLKKWNKLSPDYLNGLIEHVTAFEIKVDDIEGKFKLSQNRRVTEQRRITDAFAAADDENKRNIAQYMEENLSRLILFK